MTSAHIEIFHNAEGFEHFKITGQRPLPSPVPVPAPTPASAPALGTAANPILITDAELKQVRITYYMVEKESCWKKFVRRRGGRKKKRARKTKKQVV